MENKNLSKFLETISGKWIAIGGNRWIDSKTSKKINFIVKKLIKLKCKIVTGGAEGTDHVVMKSCLKCKIPKNNLKVFLPFTIEKQYQYESKLEGNKKIKILLNTLLKIKKYYPNSITENKHKFKNYRKAADFRNSLIVKRADGAIIFKPQNSIGTLDALNKIKKKEIPYVIFK